MVTIDAIQAKKPSQTLQLRLRLLTWIGRLDLATERWRTRQALLRLEDDQLRDIGLTRAEADHEGRRGFWD